MDFKIDTDSSNERQTQRLPPNYSSGAVRLRLATLVAMLGLAIVAMHEAGKPQTWERLGFTSQPAAADHSLDIAIQPHAPLSEPTIDRPDSTLEEFWSIQFQQMSSRETKLLSGILRYANNPDREPTYSKDQAVELIEFLNIRFDDFAAENNEKQFTPEQRREFEFTHTLLADAAAGNPLVSRNKKVVAEIQNLFDEHLYGLVEDRSALSRSAESLAWVRTWDRLANKERAENFEEASFIQLVGQPDAWRGKLISVSGIARGLESVATSNPELDMDSYYVLWIKPAGANQTPYCVYVKQLPPGFPAPNGKFQAIDKPVTIDGIFFKLRSYVASNDKIETCPLILADTVQLQTPAVTSTTNRWNPPVWLLTIFFVGMPVIAALLAISAYRSTKTSRFMPGKNSNREINESLSAMAGDGAIKTDQEKIRELYETESQNL